MGPVQKISVPLFSWCFHEDNEDQDHVEYPVDPRQQNQVLNISQTGHEIHQWNLLLHLHTDLVTIKYSRDHACIAS